MANTSYMARFGARLVNNGYGILPIGPGTKKPGQFKRGVWADYPEWNRHTERPTTEVEVTTWSTWPECGIGLVGGTVAAVDIDVVEDAELALHIEQLARERLGDTPALRIGKAPKRMLIYRTATPFRGIKRHPLEVLCLGQQFVAYANPRTLARPMPGQRKGWLILISQSCLKSPQRWRAPFLMRPMHCCPNICGNVALRQDHLPRSTCRPIARWGHCRPLRLR